MTTQPETIDEHYELALQTLRPDHVFLMEEEEPIRFGAFEIAVRRLANALRIAGLTKGQLVGYSLQNGMAAFALPVAISRLGAACLPLFPMAPDEVRSAAFQKGRVRYVVVPRESQDNFLRIARAQGASYDVLAIEDLLLGEEAPLPPAIATPDQPFLLATSSGTTGTPKPIFLSQRNAASALSAAKELAAFGPWSEKSSYRAMIAFPQSTSGILILLGTAFLGVCQVYTRSLSPGRFLSVAQAVQVDSISAPPAWCEALLQVPRTAENEASTVRGIATGMDFVAPSLLQRLAARFPALEAVANGYGLVETATVFMCWKSTSKADFAGPTSVLKLCETLRNEIRVCNGARENEPGENGARENGPGDQVAFGEEGELWVKGPSVIASYVGSSDGFKDGWFRTGDIVRSIDARTIELRGRSKYLIKRGGKSISPLVVQEAIDASPGVLRSAIVGIPHPLFGEMVWAFVVPRPGEHPTVATVMKSARTSLPTHMVPDRVEFIDAIPIGRGVGKVDREALIAQGKAMLESLGA